MPPAASTAPTAAWLWGPTVCLAVIATGNHFVADIAAGAAITVAGSALGRAVEVSARLDAS